MVITFAAGTHANANVFVLHAISLSHDGFIAVIAVWAYGIRITVKICL